MHPCVHSARFIVLALFVDSIVWTGHSSSLVKQYTMIPVIVRPDERSRRPTWHSYAACLYLFLCIVCNQPVQLVFTLTQVCIVCCGVYRVMWSVFTAPQMLRNIRLKVRCKMKCSVCKCILIVGCA